MSTYDTNIPGASGYAGAALLAKRAYDNALASVNQRRQGTLSQYGYTGTPDATGQLTNFHVDPFNPYGQFQQMRRGNAMASQDLLGADQARGIGSGGGLAAQDQNDLRYGFGLADKAMGQGLIDTLGGYSSELTNAAYSRDAALWQAQQAAAQAAIDNGSFNPANDPGSGTGGDTTGGDSTGGEPSTAGIPTPGVKGAPSVKKLLAGSPWGAPAKKAPSRPAGILKHNTAGPPASRKSIMPPKRPTTAGRRGGH